MKNRPYPYYELPKIGDLREMVKLKTETKPEQAAFAWFDRAGELSAVSYKRFARETEAVGEWLLHNGYGGKHIALLGPNSYEWLVIFLAVVNSGGVAIAADKDMSGEELSYALSLAEADAVFCAESCLKTLTAVNSQIPAFSIDRMKEYASLGETLLEAGNKAFEELKLDVDAPAAIFFTSGTTGKRKAVMLSHRNMAADINGSCALFVLEGNTYEVLPFHHAFGLIVGVWMVFHYGYTTYLSLSQKRIKKELALVKPQTMMLVPLYVETFHKQIWNEAKKNGKDAALRNAIRLSGGLCRLGIDLRKKLFKEIREFFGGELTYIICGGAPLDPKYVRAFRNFGVEVLNGYGTTECSPVVAVNRNFCHKDGSVGLPLPGTEVKISEEGEVLVGGEHVMLGYYHDEEATAEAIKDGFYGTGDLGEIDKNGFITLYGRKKNLIILSNGENVMPEELEQKLSDIEGIDEVLVSGNEGVIRAEIYGEEIARALKNDPEKAETLKKEVEGRIDQLNRKLPAYKKISAVAFREEEFEKTTTRKIKR